MSVRTKIKDNCPKKEKLDLPKWMQRDNFRGLRKHSDRETDDESFDTIEMCEYCTSKQKNWKIKRCESQHGLNSIYLILN